MIGFAKMNTEDRDEDYWNINNENDSGLFDLLRLITCVIPVAYVFRCGDNNAKKIRLIMITDQHQYQDAEQTKMILNFVTIGYSNIHLMYFCYGTIFDFLQKAHLFISSNCIPANCIFKRKGLDMLPNGSSLCTAKLKDEALSIFSLEMEKVSDFFNGAELYFKQNKLNMTAFMLHQTCEQLYRLIILIFRRKDFKSHQLLLLRKEAAFYFPTIYNVFHAKESKELKWLNLLQGSYLGTRYQDDYSIKLKECVFIKEKIEVLLTRVKTELFHTIS